MFEVFLIVAAIVTVIFLLCTCCVACCCRIIAPNRPPPNTVVTRIVPQFVVVGEPGSAGHGQRNAYEMSTQANPNQHQQAITVWATTVPTATHSTLNYHLQEDDPPPYQSLGFSK